MAWLDVVRRLLFSLRDTRTAAKMLDHIADMNDELCPFPKVALRHLCSQMGVENDNPHDAPGDAKACTKFYRCLVTRYRIH